MVGRDGDRGCVRGRDRGQKGDPAIVHISGKDGDSGHGRGRCRKGRPRLSTGPPLDLHLDSYTLVGSSSGTTISTSGRPPPIATTTPSRQEPQIHMMPTPDTQGPGTSTTTGHSATSAPKIRYDGAKCWLPPKPDLKRIYQVFKENYNKSWLSFDEADDDTQKIWWTKWRKCFDILDTEEDGIYQAWRFRAVKRL
ncbi:hypothetical protein AHAS_Ahas19G0180200 [Arachis hypogaea]